MNKTVQIVVIAVFVVVGYGVWHYKGSIPFLGNENVASASKPRERPPQGVVAAGIEVKSLPRVITAVGTARANESVDITSKVTAKIQSVNFTEGQSVKAGSLLIQLDDTELRANLAESEAERDNSQKLYDRALKLYATKNTPKAQVDLLLSELQAGEAKILADKARINDHKIRAPFSGKLGLREVSVGSLIRPGDMITTLDDTSVIKIDFDLPESFLAEVSPNQAFSAYSVAYPDLVFEGTVETIATRIDPVTRAVRIRGIVPNEEGLLKPGMFLRINLQVTVDENVSMIPEEALVTTATGHYVFSIEGDTANRTPVEIGRRTKGLVEIVKGLNEDDIVVIEGLQKIRSGADVAVTMAPSAMANEASQ